MMKPATKITMKIKTYPAVSLLSALFIALATSAKATTILQSAWTENQASAGAVNIDGSALRVGGVPSARGAAMPIVWTSPPNHDVTVGNYTASAASRASQLADFNNGMFQFSGEASVGAQGDPALYGFLAGGQARASHYIDFEIVGQNETMTLDFTQVSLVNPGPGFDVYNLGFAYELFNKTTNQGSGSHMLHSPTLVELSLAPVATDLGLASSFKLIPRGRPFFEAPASLILLASLALR